MFKRVLQKLLLSPVIVIGVFVSWFLLNLIIPSNTTSTRMLRESFQQSNPNHSEYVNSLKQRIIILEQKVKELMDLNAVLNRNDVGTCQYLMGKYEKCFVCEKENIQEDDFYYNDFEH